jgi:hypothetical protein
MIKQIMEAVSIPVMAKVRIGHVVEAQILQAVGVDYIDVSSSSYSSSSHVLPLLYLPSYGAGIMCHHPINLIKSIPHDNHFLTTITRLNNTCSRGCSLTSLSQESEVLTPADDQHHIGKHAFKVPFVCGCKNLGEALRRISEGAA